jgi:hypothetical protein
MNLPSPESTARSVTTVWATAIALKFVSTYQPDIVVLLTVARHKHISSRSSVLFLLRAAASRPIMVNVVKTRKI